MENNKRPTVSVVMPAYNAERFVEQAILSVRNQSVTDWDLLVLDDGSTDRTVQIVQRLAAEDSRIRIILNEKNIGVARTRNRGFDLCQGQYVALLDSDDIWHPQKLEKQLALAEEKNADLVYCTYAIVDGQGQKVRLDYVVPETVSLQDLLRENVIGCSTVLMSSEVLKKYRFTTEFYHEDYVLWLQLLQDGYVAVGCREALVDWRLIENSRSFNKRRSAQNRWKIYRKCLHLPFGKSVRCFVSYALAGIRKYRRRHN